MKFRDFKIIIDGTLDNNEDAETIKSMFGNKAKVEEPETNNDDPTDGSDPEKSNMAFPLQQELEMKKAEQGKTSDTIDDITDDEDIEAEQDSIPLPTLLKTVDVQGQEIQKKSTAQPQE